MLNSDVLYSAGTIVGYPAFPEGYLGHSPRLREGGTARHHDTSLTDRLGGGWLGLEDLHQR